MTISILPLFPQSSLISFRELAKTLPSRRMGRPIAISTLHRWRTIGSQGIKLEAIRIGGSWYTSAEAFQSFCDRVSAARASSDLSHTSVVTYDNVDAALRAFGYSR